MQGGVGVGHSRAQGDAVGYGCHADSEVMVESPEMDFATGPVGSFTEIIGPGSSFPHRYIEEAVVELETPSD